MALWHSNSRLAPSGQLITKGIVLKKGLSTPFCWSEANAYRFRSVFIWKRSNLNGQRFHEQNRIETKTEQCERGLSQHLADRLTYNPYYPYRILTLTCKCINDLSPVNLTELVILRTAARWIRNKQFLAFFVTFFVNYITLLVLWILWNAPSSRVGRWRYINAFLLIIIIISLSGASSAYFFHTSLIILTYYIYPMRATAILFS